MPTVRKVISKFYQASGWFGIIGLLYLYIFQPPIISKFIFLGLEIVIFLLFQLIYQGRPLNDFYRSFKFEINTLNIIVCYTIFRDLLGGEMVYSDRMIYFTFQTFYFSSFIIWLFNRKKVNIEQFMLYAGILGSIITLAMMISPSVNSVLSKYMSEELANYENFEIRYRGYGLSENITFTYSYVLGLCASLCLIRIKKKILYALPFLTCLIGVAFNARIGFLPIMLTVAYTIIVNRDWKTPFKFLFGLLIAGFCIYLVWKEQIEVYMEVSGGWISNFFFEIIDTLFGTSLSTNSGDSTIETLTGSFIIFPDSIFDWVFGTGKSLFHAGQGDNTDIGYILQLNYGGLIFLTMIFCFIFFSIIRYWRLNKMSWFSIIYLFSVLILNYKGYFFAGTPGARFIYLFYIWGILESKKLLYIK